MHPHLHTVASKLAGLLLACAAGASAAASANTAAKTPAAASATPGKTQSAAPATATIASEVQALASRKACLNCHNIDRKVIGPALKDVAERYRKQKGAEQRLVDKVLKGGSGAWGPVAMPANSQVDEAQARQLVRWVLSLK